MNSGIILLICKNLLTKEDNNIWLLKLTAGNIACFLVGNPLVIDGMILCRHLIIGLVQPFWIGFAQYYLQFLGILGRTSYSGQHYKIIWPTWFRISSKYSVLQRILFQYNFNFTNSQTRHRYVSVRISEIFRLICSFPKILARVAWQTNIHITLPTTLLYKTKYIKGWSFYLRIK